MQAAIIEDNLRIIRYRDAALEDCENNDASNDQRQTIINVVNVATLLMEGAQVSETKILLALTGASNCAHISQSAIDNLTHAISSIENVSTAVRVATVNAKRLGDARIRRSEMHLDRTQQTRTPVKTPLYDTLHGCGALFLRGVFKRDCKTIEDIWCERLALENDETESHEVKYDKLPVMFTGLVNWPKRTNLSCNWCHRDCNSLPWFEPCSIEPVRDETVGSFMSREDLATVRNTNKHSIITRGVFCNAHCVAAWVIVDTKIKSLLKNKMSMLEYVYTIMTNGKVLKPILPSPSPLIMQRYGGNTSDEEYQRSVNRLSQSSKVKIHEENFRRLCSSYLD